MRIDDFASVFRSAVKPTFAYSPLELHTAVVVTDRVDAEPLLKEVQALLSHMDTGEHVGLVTLRAPEDWTDVPSLLARIDAIRPQLLIAHRNLLADKELHHSVGTIVDTLTQKLEQPVLLLPEDTPLREATRVMVVTDHLTGDDRLVNWAIHVTPDEGTLLLAHIEDVDVFNRYADVLGRMTGVPTESVVEGMKEKLLGLPLSYVQAVEADMRRHDVRETVVPLVELGQPLAHYARLIEEHDVRLLVCNTKDPDQRAMQALSHALAVQLRGLPLLLL